AGSAAVLALIDHCFAEEADPDRAVGRWFELSARLLVDSDYASGCPVATVALETTASPGPLQDATRAAFDAWEKRLAWHLRRAGAGEAALAVLALLEGGLLLSRGRANVAPLRVAARQAQAIVGRAAGASELVTA